ncbi:gelsolin repeat protein [Teratosphaeria destructans]|uniref:Gelsolin repeat protein n=1 Tax=Teratosphaeria destructans TaxID=418781 RepID=A0A9W7VZC7_9PEZI|nr:gelsolin repeat protein [Teratosphaeria destructans]
MAESNPDAPTGGRTTRKTIQAIMPDGTVKALAQQDEYTLHEEGVYICGHSHVSGSSKKASAYVWRGRLVSDAVFEQGKGAAKRVAYEMSAGTPVVVLQGHEPASFLQALGGIMVTRRGSREGAPKKYMLCGRKHLGHITFDEVDFVVTSLCAGFVYLISYPVTLQQMKMYLWKGSACSAEEISAARLAAMDLSETGEIIEVDNGAEFASFLRIFGIGTTKASVPKTTPFLRQKALAPDRFKAHLFRIQQLEEKPSLFHSLLNRRPSWNGRSPSCDNEEVKVAAKHISPFGQDDFEAEGIYLLDAHSELHLILGPLFASQQENVRDTLLAQALLFTAEYADIAAEERPMAPQASVLFRGFPPDLKILFRHWDEQRGLWGTAGLMAGIRASMANDVKVLPVDDVLTAVCQD